MFSVLYVDDDLALLEIGKIYLEKLGGFYVDITSSALTALNLITSKRYDAIISDYEMPQMNGIEFLKQVRSSGNDIPFILFTGRGREEVVIQALNEGADFYLQKGVDTQPQFTELSHKVFQAVKKRITESALAESEERYRAVVEDQTELICRFNPDNELTFVNDAYCRYFHLEKNQCLFRPHSIKLPPEDALLMKQHLVSLSPDNPAAFIEHRICMPDGTIRWQQWNDHAIFGKGGQVVEYQSVGRDISERRQAEDALRESEEKYRMIVETTQEGIWILDADIHTVFVNAGMAEMLGYTLDEMKGRPITDFLHPNQLQNYEHIVVQMKKGIPQKFERLFLTKSGEKVWGLVSSTPVFKDTIFEGVLSMITDITERKQMEETVIQANETLVRQKKTMSVLNQIIISANQAKNPLDILKDILEKTLAFLDYDGGRIHIIDPVTETATCICSLNHPEEYLAETRTVSIRNSPYNLVLIEGKPLIIDYYEELFYEKHFFELAQKTGFTSLASIPLFSKERIIGALNLVSKRQHKVNEDEKEAFLLIGREVGNLIERITTEDALRKSEERYRELFNSITDAIFVHEYPGTEAGSGNFIEVNAKACQMLGFSREELLRLSPLKIRAPEFSTDLKPFREHLIHGEDASIEHMLVRKDQQRIPVDIHCHVFILEGKRLIIAIVRDITERKRRENALQESEEKFRMLSENARDGIYRMSLPDGRYEYVSPAFATISGYSPENHYTNPLLLQSIIHPDWRDYLEHMWKRLLAGDVPAEYEFQIIHKSGEIIWVNQRNRLITDTSGNLVALEGIVTDITERKRTENALREREERFRLVFNSSTDAMIVHRFTTDMQPGKIVEVNETICQRYGYSRDELLQMRPQDIDADMGRAVLSHNIVHRLITEGHATWEGIHSTKNGHTFPVEIVETAFEYDGEQMGLASARDITERKKVENALRQTNRQITMMTIITRHDIINQISIILANLEKAKIEFPNPAIKEFIKKIESPMEVIRSQIEFTRVYQDLGSNEPQWLEPDNLLHLLQIPATITLIANLQGLEIYADLMLEKVFFNLLDNSVRHGERVTKIRVSSFQTDDGLTIIWEDNGIGIAPTKKEQIFHRGFGKNTGFGLFLVREILSLTGVTITETGEPEVGARFEIFVPNGGYRINIHSNPLGMAV